MLTTLVGFRVGLSELSPFVSRLAAFDPTLGLMASKLIAFVLGGLCIGLQRAHLIRWINYWYAGLVVWNLTLILSFSRGSLP